MVSYGGGATKRLDSSGKHIPGEYMFRGYLIKNHGYDGWKAYRRNGENWECVGGAMLKSVVIIRIREGKIGGARN